MVLFVGLAAIISVSFLIIAIRQNMLARELTKENETLKKEIQQLKNNVK